MGHIQRFGNVASTVDDRLPLLKAQARATLVSIDDIHVMRVCTIMAAVCMPSPSRVIPYFLPPCQAVVLNASGGLDSNTRQRLDEVPVN